MEPSMMMMEAVRRSRSLPARQMVRLLLTKGKAMWLRFGGVKKILRSFLWLTENAFVSISTIWLLGIGQLKGVYVIP